MWFKEKWFKEKLQKFTMVDWAVFKGSLVLLGMIIGSYLAGFVQVNLLYFIVAFVVLYAIVLYRVFGK